MFTKKSATIEDIEQELKRGFEDADLRQKDMLNKLMDFIANDLRKARGMAIVWRESNRFNEMYWKSGGIEPAEAILLLDQLHHKIQHEGLPGYE